MDTIAYSDTNSDNDIDTDTDIINLTVTNTDTDMVFYTDTDYNTICIDSCPQMKGNGLRVSFGHVV